MRCIILNILLLGLLNSCSNYQVYKIEEGRSEIIYVNEEDSGFNVLNGVYSVNDSCDICDVLGLLAAPAYFNFRYSKELGTSFGNLQPIIYNPKSKKKYEVDSLEASIYTGEWRYYSKSGLLDSIIDYKRLERIYWEVDSGFDGEGNLLHIDSMIRMSYKKEKTYYRSGSE